MKEYIIYENEQLTAQDELNKFLETLDITSAKGDAFLDVMESRTISTGLLDAEDREDTAGYAVWEAEKMRFQRSRLKKMGVGINRTEAQIEYEKNYIMILALADRAYPVLSVSLYDACVNVNNTVKG